MIVLEMQLASKAHARFDVIQCQRNPVSVELEHHVRQHIAPVLRGFLRRDGLIAITIDERDDPFGNARAWCEIDLQLHARVRERHARGLKVFVETMSRWRCGQYKKKAREDRKSVV